MDLVCRDNTFVFCSLAVECTAGRGGETQTSSWRGTTKSQVEDPFRAICPATHTHTHTHAYTSELIIMLQ